MSDINFQTFLKFVILETLTVAEKHHVILSKAKDLIASYAFAKNNFAVANFYFALAFSENISMFEGKVEEEFQILLQQLPR